MPRLNPFERFVATRYDKLAAKYLAFLSFV